MIQSNQDFFGSTLKYVPFGCTTFNVHTSVFFLPYYLQYFSSEGQGAKRNPDMSPV